MPSYKYVIVGGGLAGGKAVEGIRELDKDGTIALVTQEPRRPYNRPPLSKGYLIGEKPESEIYVAAPDAYEKQGVDLMTSTQVTALDPDARTVTLGDGRTLHYETLLLATGGRPRRLPLEGNELPGIFTLRTVEDSTHIRESAGQGKQALILGGSFIGSEVAAGLSMLGTDVTMVFPEERLLQAIVPRAMSEYIEEIYAAHNVRILPGVVPEEFFGGSHVERVELSNGAMPHIDMVVMGVGILLNTELAREAGLDTREEDKAVIVNEYLQTSDPHIYAAGDIAAWQDVNFDKRLRVEHWDVARSQGLQAGRNMAGAHEVYDELPYFFSDLFDLSFEVWGDLSSWDDAVMRGEFDTRSVAYFYFRDGRLVGVFAWGRPDEEREPMQALVRQQPRYEDVAEALRNSSANLQELSQSPQGGAK